MLVVEVESPTGLPCSVWRNSELLAVVGVVCVPLCPVHMKCGRGRRVSDVGVLRINEGARKSVAVRLVLGTTAEGWVCRTKVCLWWNGSRTKVCLWWRWSETSEFPPMCFCDGNMCHARSTYMVANISRQVMK